MDSEGFPIPTQFSRSKSLPTFPTSQPTFLTSQPSIPNSLRKADLLPSSLRSHPVPVEYFTETTNRPSSERSSVDAIPSESSSVGATSSLEDNSHLRP